MVQIPSRPVYIDTNERFLVWGFVLLRASLSSDSDVRLDKIKYYLNKDKSQIILEGQFPLDRTNFLQEMAHPISAIINFNDKTITDLGVTIPRTPSTPPDIPNSINSLEKLCCFLALHQFDFDSSTVRIEIQDDISSVFFAVQVRIDFDFEKYITSGNIIAGVISKSMTTIIDNNAIIDNNKLIGN